MSATEQARRIFKVTGVLKSLVEIFKHGHREKLSTCIECVPVLYNITQYENTQGGLERVNSLQRKLIIKLSQRIGLQYLPPRVVKWRYQRGKRSLLQNLSTSEDEQANPHILGNTTGVSSGTFFPAVSISIFAA